MKRWIHTNMKNVLCMSIPRGKAKDKIEALGDIILAHVCKCVLYSASAKDYNHWIEDEIANWISLVNDLTIKPNNKKLKEKDYDLFLLGGFGDDMVDAKINLNLFYRKFRSDPEPYPEVNITDSMVANMYEVTQKFHELIPSMISQNNNLTQSDIANKIHNIMDPICKGE